MKKNIYMIICSLLLGLNSSFASIDPCEKILDVKNNWVLEFNKNNASTKEEVLQTLDLLAEQGFKVVFWKNEYSGHLKFIVSFKNNSLAGADQILNEKRKLNVLKDLQSIAGNQLECNFIGL